MRTRTCLGMIATSCFVASAIAQLDNAPYPTFKANSERRGSAVVPGPALAHAWTLNGVGTTTAGGASVASNGDVYFKTQDNGTTRVYRVSPAGTILATSPVFGTAGAGNGHHSGVAIGVNAVYTTIAPFGDTNRVLQLDKNTLAIVNSWTSPNFVSIRGTPAISTFANGPGGSYTLYLADRGGKKIHAVNASTGEVRWSYTFLGTEALFDQIGPFWTVAGKQRIGYFRRDTFFSGMCLEDNGDSSQPTLVWEGGPDNFNWWGSGALSADGTAIYVTTFNDGLTPSLWKISASDGSIVWSVDGRRGECDELNFFARPCVIGNRIYCAGGAGVVACFEDAGSTVTKVWEYRNGGGENTGYAAIQTPDGRRFIYVVSQSVFINGVEQTYAEYFVFEDLGSTFAIREQTTLNNSIKFSINAGNAPAVAPDGSVYFGSGRANDPTGQSLYKFALGPASPKPGRCCLPSGSCTQVTAAACAEAGGTFGGENTTCDPTSPTVVSTSPNATIPDGDGDPNTPDVPVISTINVAQSFTVTDVNVSVEIPDHTFLGDLLIELTHNGTTVTLWDGGCGSSDGLDVTFSDEGASVLCLCSVSGTIRTVGAAAELLSLFDGMNSSGDWTLTVIDRFAQDVGTLASWGLALGGADDPCGGDPCPCPGDFTGDNSVGLGDLSALLSSFGGAPSNPCMDTDGDDLVGLSDLSAFLSQFGSTCN